MRTREDLSVDRLVAKWQQIHPASPAATSKHIRRLTARLWHSVAPSRHSSFSVGDRNVHLIYSMSKGDVYKERLEGIAVWVCGGVLDIGDG